MDITDAQDLGDTVVALNSEVTSTIIPATPRFNETIHPILSKLDIDNMRNNLQAFSSFHTRYYKSDYGRQSQKWLLEKIERMLSDAIGNVFPSLSSSSVAEHTQASVETFPHPWGQSSLILRIPGLSNKTVIVSAHQDSINLYFPSFLSAPGADDDGSGTVTILEAARIFLTQPDALTGLLPNTVEFHWYSAEEGGLLGSQAVYKAYAHEGRDVIATLQLDGVGYAAGTAKAGKPEAVGIVTDFVDEKLTGFVKELVKSYANIEPAETKCGYACSDHASANKAGFRSACVMESEFGDMDPRFHTSNDRVEYLSFEHMREFGKVALGFAVELAMAV